MGRPNSYMGMGMIPAHNSQGTTGWLSQPLPQLKLHTAALEREFPLDPPSYQNATRQ